jgi:hypothetical protein
MTMARIVNISFFVGDINIPNTSKPEVAESLQLFIDKYEEELLNQLLGNELYHLVVDPIPTQYDERFQKLVYGDAAANWRGLVYDYGTPTQYSLIAYYIYWWWLKNKYIWNSGIGTVRPKGSSVDVMSPALPMIEAWNTFSEQVGELYDYMRYYSDVYPEWEPYNLWQFNKVNDFDI